MHIEMNHNFKGIDCDAWCILSSEYCKAGDTLAIDIWLYEEYQDFVDNINNNLFKLVVKVPNFSTVEMPEGEFDNFDDMFEALMYNEVIEDPQFSTGEIKP